MRQIGILAATGFGAFRDRGAETMPADYANAKALAARRKYKGISIDVASVVTNIVIFDAYPAQVYHR